MPVLDHEVHYSVKQDNSAKYGCWNRTRSRDIFKVKNGWSFEYGRTTAKQEFTLINDFGSLECRYDQSLLDNKCEGCNHRGSGESYAKMIKENGK